MNKKNYLQWVILILVVLIVAMPLSFSGTSFRDYDEREKIISISDTNGAVANLQLIDNTYSCGTDCYAIIKINPAKNLGVVDLSREKAPDYGWEFKGSGMKEWQLYRIDNYGKVMTYTTTCVDSKEINITSGKIDKICTTTSNDDGQKLTQITNLDLSKEQYIKLVGVKDRFANVDWIPIFYGLKLTEWANWTGQITINSPTNSSYNTKSILVNITLGLGSSGTATLHENYTAGDNTVSDCGNVQFSAQSFTPNTDINISYVKLKVYKAGTPGVFTINLYAADVNHKPTGGVLSTGSINGNDLTASSPGDWYQINMSAYELQTATEYVLVGSAAAAEVDWRLDSAGASYAGGIYLYSTNAGSTWTAYADGDLMFEVYSFSSYDNLGTTWFSNDTGNTTYTTAQNYTWSAGTHKITAYANDTSGVVNSTSVWFYIIPASLDLASPTLNSIYYLPANINLNYSAVGAGISSCWFSVNNGLTNYTLPSCENTTLNGNITHLGNNSVYLWMNDTDSNLYFDYTSFYVMPTFSFCNATITQSVLNITFKDESDLTSINATMDSGSTFTYWVVGYPNTNKTYTYTNAVEQTNYTFCINPNWGSIQTDYTIKYKNSESPQRTYSTSDNTLNNATTEKTLYLLSSSAGIYVSFQVVNSASQAIQGAVVNASTAASGLIETKSTDAAGIATMFLDPNTPHTITVVKEGYETYSAVITPTQTQYTIQLASTGGEEVTSYANGISYTIYPLDTSLINNTIYNFSLSLTSSVWILESWGFNITDINGTQLDSISSTTTGGGYISKNISTGTNSSFILVAYWITNGTLTSTTKLYTISNLYGTEWSIKNLFTDFGNYLGGDGIFGLKKGFGLNIVIFLVIFIITGIFSWKFGLNSPLSVIGIIFALMFIFDVLLGVVYFPYRPAWHFPTIFTFIIFMILMLREGTSY